MRKETESVNKRDRKENCTVIESEAGLRKNGNPTSLLISL